MAQVPTIEVKYLKGASWRNIPQLIIKFKPGEAAMTSAELLKLSKTPSIRPNLK